MTEKRVMKLASRGKRFGAACIDAFVPFVSYLLYSAVMAANGIRINYPGYGFGNDLGYGYGYGYGFGYDYGLGRHHLGGASTAIMVVVFFILIAYIVAQLVLFSKGKSIGKAILGLQVVSSNDGKPFRFWKMLFRECFVKSASGSVFGLGYIWILIDEKNRGWHDKILDSYVVDLKESEQINLRRHIEQARAESAKPESAPAAGPASAAEPVSAPVSEPAPAAEPVPEPAEENVPAPESEIREEEQDVIPEALTEEDTAVDVIPEVIEAETEEYSEKTGETEVNAEESGEEPEPEIPALNMSMKKEELLETARMRGVKVSSRATKAAIIEAIEKDAENNGE